MKKIAIINVYGHQNIGDGAILDESLRIIMEAYKKEISFDIHTANLNSVHLIDYDKKLLKPFLNPYGIAIKADRKINDVQKIIRFIKIYIISYSLAYLSKIFPNILPKTGDYSYIYSLKNSDKVFSVGGGYLRTKSKYKDLFGFLLTILSIRIAHFYHKKIIFLPMSFGNFASKFHEHIAYSSIRNDALFIRDKISINLLKKLGVSDLNYFPDLALLNKVEYKKKKSNYAILTARNWLIGKSQLEYEKKLSEIVDYLWDNFKLKTHFIPMSISKEDNDIEVGLRIKKNTTHKNIFFIKNNPNKNRVMHEILYARLCICTRMHSAIFSINTRTPFIIIKYEHKSEEIPELLRNYTYFQEIEKISISELKLFVKEIINYKKDLFNHYYNNIYPENLKKSKTLLKSYI